MGTTVIKMDPEVDWYLVWSSVVEFPVCWGTRADIAAWIRRWGDEGDPDKRIGRADASGSSAMWGTRGPAYGWQDPDRTVIIEQKGTIPIRGPGGLRDLCRRLEDNQRWDDLLTPLEEQRRG